MYMYFVGYRLYYLYYIMRSPSSMPVSVKHKDLFINCWETFYGIWDVPSGNQTWQLEIHYKWSF